MRTGSEGAPTRGAPPGHADALDRASPLDWALRRIGDRWALLVVDALLDGPRRFNDLAADVPKVAPNILTKRLRALEADGLVHAVRYQERPPRSRYELTEQGRELSDALRVLGSWGARHGGGDDPGFHALCGSPLETRPFCPTCERVVDDGEADGLFHA